ncbi:sulfite exporter TauE/SafE family protein [Citricoccus sp.]|uniref:sulfite exporter TauE/SafE family protein n=1 Tax=Citricoccus sp. TaxID=1978372 RepID=UPI0028BF2800|nr:sulfite exporter TauE/SafE family protein [Citricoccus sp.]
MEVLTALAILAAGLGGGLVVTAIGAGSLVTFPVLLAVGLPPVVANVSNTIGLVPGNITGTWGYRHELAGRRGLVLGVAATTAVGAVAGALLLLSLPPEAFSRLAPWLILLAATLVGVQPVVSGSLRRRALRRGDTPRGPRSRLPAPLAWVSAAIGVYGGYFGAGQGVMLVACLALGLRERLQTVNALKNVAVLAANVVAALIFVWIAPVDWAAVGLLAIGSVVGGWLGALIGRRLPGPVFRVLVVLFGYVVALRILLDAG